jgi:hypothetical protein
MHVNILSFLGKQQLDGPLIDVTYCHNIVYPPLLAQKGVWPHTSSHFRKTFCFYSPVNPQHSLLKAYRGITSGIVHSSN